MATRLSITRMDGGFHLDESTGYMTAEVYPTRAGVFLYQQSDGSVIRELRPDDEVFNAESLASLEHKAVTNSHPPVFLTADNTAEYQVGSVIGEHSRFDNTEYTKSIVQVIKKDAINDIQNGKQQVSCAYSCDVDDTPGVHPVYGEYDSVQRNIRYNHLSIEWRGRAGPGARLKLDRFDAWEIDKNKNEEISMVKIRIDNKDFEVSEAAEIAIGHKLRHDAEIIKTLKSEVEKKDSQIGELSGKVKALESELEEARKFDADAELARIDAFRQDARAILGESFEFSGKKERDVKLEAVKSRYDGVSGDISDAELSGMFKMAVAQAKRDAQRAPADTYSSNAHEKNDADSILAAAYQKNIARITGQEAK